MNDYDYTLDDLTNARADGWDDCKKLVLELLKSHLRPYSDTSFSSEFNIDVIKEIESENFGVVNCDIRRIDR